MKDLVPLKYFLGLEIIRSNTGIVICQRHYTLQILKDFGFLQSKPKSTPMPAHMVLSVDLGYLIDDATSYRRLVSRLLYLTITRSDITFVVNTISQFLSAPHTTHLRQLTTFCVTSKLHLASAFF